MSVTFYFDTKGSVVAHGLDAPVFAVKAFERGYYPIWTSATAEQLNHGKARDVLDAALIGSMFGWNVPGARTAAVYCEKLERKSALV